MNPATLAALGDAFFARSGGVRILARLDGTLVHAGPGWPALTGLRLAGASSSDLRDFVHPEDVPALESALRHLAGGGSELALTLRLRHRSGGGFPVEVRGGRPGGEELLYAVLRELDADGVSEEGSSGRAYSSGERAPEPHETAASFRELAERARDLEAIVEETGMGTWKWNVQTGEAEFDESWAEIGGYDLADLAPVSIDTWAGLVHPGDLRIAEASLRRHLAGDTPYHEAELRIRHRDGHWVWVLDRGRIRSWTPAGEPERMYGTRADVSARKEAEFEVQRSRELLRDAEQIGGLGTWLYWPQRDELTWSEEACRILGFAVGEVEPTLARFLARIHRDDRAGVREAYRVSVEEGAERYEGEYRIVRRDSGETRHIQARCRHRRDASGTVVRSVGTLLDVTERVVQERELRRRESEFRSVMENTEDFVVRLDLDGRHLFVNAAALANAGMTRQECLGRTAAEMGLPGELVELYDTTLERVAATGDTLRGSLEGAFDKTLSFTLVPEPDEAGAVASVLAIFRDVTEIVAAEKAKGEVERRLLHAQKLESLEALAGGIAHDFNNILTVLSGNVELLQLILGEEHEGAEEVTAILDAVRRAGGLTRQMLHFSGGADITLDIIDLGEVVRGVEEDLRAAVPPQVALEIRSPDEPLRVRGGVDSLRQVLVNLVSNGAEAVGDGEGRVSVVLSPIRPDAGAGVPKAVIAAPDFDPSGPLASIEVRDDGAGMSPSVLARIFEPFFSTKFEGRGLGLAAVQGIVHAHGGALAVESAPGTGSTFRLFLPCEEPEVSSTGTGAGAVPAGAQLRVLVVDDEAPVRQLLRVFLLRGGHRVSTAADGREALDHLAAEVADLVFLDMTMPHMGGAECLRRIRARWPELAVVMMSGLAAERVTQELGGERLPVLQKPFSLRAVARVTDAVIESVRSGS